MKQLWAPWRMDYILSPKKTSNCILCDLYQENNDEENLILQRGEYAYIVMNKYPYNAGHLMVIPYRHIDDFAHVNEKESIELWKLQTLCIAMLRDVLKAEGFNTGVNLGKVAGAGIQEHLHIHVVPRWANDASFLSVLADVRTIPEHLRETYQKLRTFITK